MIKSVLSASALLIGGLALASAAGGGAGGPAGGGTGAAGGAHPSVAAHGASSFGKPAVENSTGAAARRGCLGAVAVVPSTGAPWPVAPPSKTNSSPPNGSAVEGTPRSNSDLPHLTEQDQRVIGEIKLANEKLGRVGNPINGNSENRQPGRPANVTGTNEDIHRRTTDPLGSLSSRAQSDSSAAKEMTERGPVQGKPDVSRMSEEAQGLAREIIRETDKLGKVGNPGSSAERSKAQQDSLTGPNDLRHDINGPHQPNRTLGAASGSAC
jgi:hypothetical protein